jgi:DNA-binding transcriptional ArsR family regulator
MSSSESSELTATKRRALSDPLRLKMWEQLRIPRLWTIAELADQVRASSLRVRHHLKVLENAGLVEVAGTAPSGTGHAYCGKHDDVNEWGVASDPVEQAQFASAWFDASKSDIEHAIYEQARQAEAGERVLGLNWGRATFQTSVKGLVEFNDRLLALIEEFASNSARVHKELKGSPPSDWTSVAVTFAICESPLPEWWPRSGAGSGAE